MYFYVTIFRNIHVIPIYFEALILNYFNNNSTF